MDRKTSNYVEKVLKLMEKYELMLDGDVWWRTDGVFAPITFFVGCNDVFYWGTADCELLKKDQVKLFEQACKDCEDITSHGAMMYGAMLYCARVRNMRPQGPMYSSIDKEFWPLFHAAGPERELGFSNACHPGEYEKKRIKPSFKQKVKQTWQIWINK